MAILNRASLPFQCALPQTMVEITLMFTLPHCQTLLHLCFLLLDVPLISLQWFSCLDWNKWYPWAPVFALTSMWRCFFFCSVVVTSSGWPQQLHTGLYWVKYVIAWGRRSSEWVCGQIGSFQMFFSRWKMSAVLWVHLKISSMLIGSFGVCMNTEIEKAGLLRYSLWTWAPSHLAKTLFWQALNYLHSSLPKLFKYVRSWSNRKAFRAYGRASPCGLLGIRHENRERTKACQDC